MQRINRIFSKAIPMQAQPQLGLFARARKRVSRFVRQKRVIRYGLLGLNIIALAGVILFVLRSSPVSIASYHNAAANTEAASDPLDQLSSADIAVNVAQMTSLAETTAVSNQADSVGAELAVPPAQTTVIAKPQAVETDLKSRKDIFTYTVKPADTIASIAAQFNVTSDSILWSNGITGNVVAVGTKLIIPPVSGIVYTVKPGDTPDTLAQKYRASRDQIIAYNDAEISGISVGEQIIIPNGQQPTTGTSRSGLYSGLSLAGFSAIYGFNGYDPGFCTWYVANKRMQIGRPLPSNLGDAWTWDDRAAAAGIKVDNNPAVGDAVVTNTTHNPGHVAFVEAVNADGSVWISEMNSRGQVSMTNSAPAGGFNRVDYKLIPASEAHSYNYIH